MHLVGVGVPRTCATSAVFLSFLRQFCHFLATGDFTRLVWDQLSARRHRCSASLPRFIEGAAAFAGITWSSACTFSFGVRMFTMLDESTTFIDTNWRAAALTLRSAPFRKKLLKGFLDTCVGPNLPPADRGISAILPPDGMKTQRCARLHTLLGTILVGDH